MKALAQFVGSLVLAFAAGLAVGGTLWLAADVIMDVLSGTVL